MAIIDTKKCKTINPSNPELKENSNKHIPEELTKKEGHADKKKKTNPETLGRGLFYQLDLIISPVLKSFRTKPSEGRRTLPKESFDSLCEDFEKLMTTKSLTDSEGEQAPPEEQEEETGRLNATVFNYRTCETYKVKRSARIAKKYWCENEDDADMRMISMFRMKYVLGIWSKSWLI